MHTASGATSRSTRSSPTSGFVTFSPHDSGRAGARFRRRRFGNGDRSRSARRTNQAGVSPKPTANSERVAALPCHYRDMSKAQNMTIDDALQQIVDWSTRRPRWMSAALIALTAGAADDTEIARLADLAVAECSGDVSQPFVTLRDLRGAVSALPTVKLRFVENVNNVNRLASGEKLEFATDGLSVVYGSNGSGKSGYTRIFKQVCRVRGAAPPILPNVYASAALPASADIGTNVGGTDVIENWTSGSAASPDFKHINVFDSAAASASVKDAAAAPFVPYPVRLLESLGSVIGRVRVELDERIATAADQRPVIAALSQPSEFDHLVARVGLDMTKEDLELSVGLTKEEELELKGLVDDAAKIAEADVISESVSISRQLDGLEAFADSWAAVAALLDAEAIEASDSFGSRMRDARKAADASVLLLSGNSLEGIGTEQWKALWEKARQYSNEHAYPDQVFPHVAAGAVCVLCEQPLSSQAANRFTDLESFVNDSSQAAYSALKEEFADWLSESSEVLAAPSLEVPQEIARLAEKLNVELVDLVKSSLREAQDVLDAHAVTRKGEVAAGRARPEPQGEEVLAVQNWDGRLALDAVEEIRNHLASRQKNLADSQDQEKLLTDATRQALLTERKGIAAASDDLTKHESLNASISACTKAKATCSTNATTDLSGKLSEGLITDALRDGLARELMQLGADRLSVSVAQETVKTKSSFRLKLTTSSGVAVVGDVLSEGELRVLALAAFFMEIKLTGGASAIVFDDPVSSLDHQYRERVAKRLAAESVKRQVIVFTHDLVFLDELAGAARQLGSTPSISAIKSTAAGTGVASLDLPAAGGSFDTQLKHIDAAIAAAKSIWLEDDAEKWAPVSRRIAGDLRTAWERGVEEVLLFKTVSRFRASVMTLKLREVHVEDHLWKELESAMTELSGKGPHDAATAQQSPPLAHHELSAGLDRIRAWRTAVSASRKTTVARRESLLPKAT